MGNWMSVQMDGTMDAAQVQPLTNYLRYKDGPSWDWTNFGPLSIGEGLCGLGSWPAEVIVAVGNVAERNYDPESVADHLRDCLKIAPSLNVKVHCGGDYESKECIATVVAENGVVSVEPPQREKIASVSEVQIQGNLFKSLFGQ